MFRGKNGKSIEMVKTAFKIAIIIIINNTGATSLGEVIRYVIRNLNYISFIISTQCKNIVKSNFVQTPFMSNSKAIIKRNRTFCFPPVDLRLFRIPDERGKEKVTLHNILQWLGLDNKT